MVNGRSSSGAFGCGAWRAGMSGGLALLAALACGAAGCTSDGGASGDTDADVAGGDGDADASVTPEIPNSDPVVSIDTPTDGTWIEAGSELLLKALVSDAESSPSQLTLRWSSSVEGLLTEASAGGAGISVAGAVLMTAGTHVLTLEATDPQGGHASASVSVQVNGPPSAPVVAITPEDPTTGDGLEVVIVTPPTDPTKSASATSKRARMAMASNSTSIRNSRS